LVEIIKSNNIFSKDVLIDAPPAIFGSTPNERQLKKIIKSIIPGVEIDAKDVIDMQQATIRELESNLEKTRIVATTIANSCLCLYKMLLDEGYTDDGESVRFSKELVDRMKGAEISITEDGFGDRYLRITSRHDHPVWEGRQIDE
jgi:hypothetical protein